MLEALFSQIREVSYLALSICLATAGLVALILVLRKKDHLEINVLGYHVIRIDRIGSDNPTPQEKDATPADDASGSQKTINRM